VSESINDALVECVKACGGSKAVGPQLWPELAPDAAQRKLLDSLNEDRQAKLSPEQVVLILRLARERGCHVGMTFLASALGYTQPEPIAPADELAELQRTGNELTRQLLAQQQRIEQLLKARA